MIFHCPSCRSPIGELPPTGSQILVCAGCRFKYRVTAGVLESNDSRQITRQRETWRQEGWYEREYEFRLARPNGQIELVTARIDGRDDRFRAQRNDRVAIIHAMRGHATENLVALANLTTGHLFMADLPGKGSRSKAIEIAGIGFLGLAYLLTTFGISLLGAMVIALLAAVSVFVWLDEVFKPRHALTPAEQNALARSTSLLQQKAVLAQRMAAVDRDRQDKIAVRDKLLSLKEKMDGVGADLYQTRIERIQQAIPLIDEQLELDEKLLAACGKALTMVEIELESQGAAGAIPDDIVEALQERAEEIAVIESRTADVKLLLSANEEVERLLRAG